MQHPKPLHPASKTLRAVQPEAWEISDSTQMNASLAMVACMSGWVNIGYRSPPLDQLDVVEEASENADRPVSLPSFKPLMLYQ